MKTLGLQMERFGPQILAAALATAWHLAGLSVPSDNAKELLSALISAAAISAGFLTTALSILLPMGSTETGRRMHAAGYMPLLHRYLRSAMFSCLLLSGLCLAALFILEPSATAMGRWWAVIIVANTAHAAASLVRVAVVLLNLFERMSKPEDLKG